MADLAALIRAIRAKFTSPQAPLDERAAAARAGAEGIARRLPSPVMPMQGIDEDRRRKAAMDAMLADSNK